MKLRRSKAINETVELNITAFLNLMVILVPFLLITAVFSRMTVLELTLPPLNGEATAPEKIDLQLQIVITPEMLDVRDATLGRLKRFSLEEGKIDWPKVTDLLIQVKQKFPDETAVSLLLDSSVPYSRLIDVMDHVRSTEIVNVTTLEEVELFPAISIGKAPESSEPDSGKENSIDALQQQIQAGQGDDQ